MSRGRRRCATDVRSGCHGWRPARRFRYNGSSSLGWGAATVKRDFTSRCAAAPALVSRRARSSRIRNGPSISPEAHDRIRDLTKTFHAEGGPVHVLKGISLTIEKGEVFGVIGRSGAGKSTLVRCINLLERPDRRAGGGRRPGADRARRAALRAARRRDRDDLPALQPALLADRARQRRAAPRARRPLARRRARRRCAAARAASGSRDKRERYPGRALRRPEAARRHRAGARLRAGGAALRRGDLGARPGDDAVDPGAARATSTGSSGSPSCSSRTRCRSSRRSATGWRCWSTARSWSRARCSTSSPRPRPR